MNPILQLSPVVIAACALSPVLAQDAAKPETTWTGSVKANGIVASGNTERRSGGLSFDAKRESLLDRYLVDATWAFSEEQAVGSDTWNLTQRRQGCGLQYDYFMSKQWYALGNARALGDTFADLDLRLSSGLGLGYTVVDGEHTKLLAEAGLSYVDEDYRSNTPSHEFFAVRLAYKLTHSFSDQVKLQHAVDALPSVEQSNDVYLQARTELIVNLTSSMLASFGHVLDYDSTPAPGRSEADNRIELSVGWSF